MSARPTVALRAVAAARRHGVQTMFTLSGGHVFPVYDGAVTADPPMPIVDVRHEQTAVFAAEATARLTRSPGFAVLTAGPGVTNGVSAITTAHFNGSPVVVLAGRAPDARWGSGSLQELDHPPLLAPVTKRAWTVHAAGQVGAAVDESFALASSPHRGPVFLDASLEALYGAAPGADGTGADGSARGSARAGSARGVGAAVPELADPEAISRHRPAAGCGSPAGPDPGLRRVARRRRARGAGRSRGTPAAGHRQRAGTRHPAGRASAAGDTGPVGRARRG